MPEFIPEHTPQGLDDFTTGYLKAVEWLLPEETNREKIRGFTRDAIKKAKEDCADFQKANATDLELYQELRGKGLEYAGHDFYLSRCGHGAGFFDRDDDPVFNRLQAAAKVYNSVYHEVYHGWIYEL